MTTIPDPTATKGGSVSGFTISPTTAMTAATAPNPLLKPLIRARNLLRSCMKETDNLLARELIRTEVKTLDRVIAEAGKRP